VRASAELQPGLVARTLARDPIVAVASPAYLKEKGVPLKRRDLRDHRCLLGFARGEVPQTHWSLAGGGKLHVEGSLFSNDVTLLRDAALAGLGIALLPMMLVGPLLDSGKLVHVLADSIRGETRIAVVYLEREFVPPPVRAFVDAVTAWAPDEFKKCLPLQDRQEAGSAGKGSRRRSSSRVAV
jgi:DNA-binding transcriptional LysR family regulator